MEQNLLELELPDCVKASKRVDTAGPVDSKHFASEGQPATVDNAMCAFELRSKQRQVKTDRSECALPGLDSTVHRLSACVNNDAAQAQDHGQGVGAKPEMLRTHLTTKVETLLSKVPIEDGGGLNSSADWLAPREAVDFFGDLRRHFISLAVQWDLVPRLQGLLRGHVDEPLLSLAEMQMVQQALVRFLCAKGFACSSVIVEHQPFLLDVWRAISLATCDIDCSLPGILTEGVPTGIIDSIPPSGVWEQVCSPEEQPSDLLVHLEPWGSAQNDEDLALSLLQKDIEAGYAFLLPGGEAEARERWGSWVAAGKLGVVKAPGKKPRLIGDGTISGANKACRIPERARLPGLNSVQRFFSLPESRSTSWEAFSFDIQGAHKLVRVKPCEQGLSCFVLAGKWYAYRNAYFGARFSAYWFSRVGAWLVRQLHRFLWIKHGLWLYVDDGLVVLPRETAPLLAGAVVLFLSALGIPLSWRKLDLGPTLAWLGWQFDFAGSWASLPSSKLAKFLGVLQPFRSRGAKVSRKAVESLIGLLIWYTSGAFWLRPWLSEFYHLLNKPQIATRLLTVDQFSLVTQQLKSDLTMGADVASCDVCLGWKLHSVGGATVLQLDSPALIAPRTKRGGVSLVFFNFASSTTTVSAESCFVANLFYTAMSVQAPIPLRGVVSGSHLGAADAFADAAIAGIGGWWLSRGKDLAPENVCWFQFLLDATTLPSWFRAEKSGSLQRCIGALEALAQLVLFLLQVKEEKLDGNLGTVTLQFRQLCDNASVTASTFKMLSMKAPLSHVLQTLGYFCCKHGAALHTSHIAGIRNEWADALSRGSVPRDFSAHGQRSLDLLAILAEPWHGSSPPGVGRS